MRRSSKEHHRLAKVKGLELQPLIGPTDNSLSSPPSEEDEGGLRSAFVWVVYVFASICTNTVSEL